LVVLLVVMWLPPWDTLLHPSATALQEILDSTRGLIKDWKTVFALCPASFPQPAVQAMRQRSRCFSSILDGHHTNFFWLTICRASQSFVHPYSCLFQPISHPAPFPSFSGVVVVISGYGDGVRRGICNAMQLLGGECVATPLPCTSLVGHASRGCRLKHPHARGQSALRLCTRIDSKCIHMPPYTQMYFVSMCVLIYGGRRVADVSRV
jgi:hypothetical protein